MSVKIKLKHSSTAGKVPTAGDLDAGEVALNTSDVKAYIKNAGGAVVQLAGSGADATKVDKAGDTMTGQLKLVGDPVADADAARKKYVDDQIVAGNLWSRTGTVVSPKTAGDDVTTTGDVNAADMTATGAVNAASVAATGDVQMASLNGGQLAGLRNRLINGDFNVWQRGTDNTSGASSAYSSADRWYVGNNCRSVKQPEASLNGASSVLKLEPKSTNAIDLRQAIEIKGTKDFPANSTWTLSFYSKAQTAGVNIKAKLFGSDGVESINLVQMTGGDVVVGSTSTNYQKFSHTFTITSEAAQSNKAVVLHLQVASTDWVHFSQIQLEPGPVATPFEHRPIGLELSLCQRYYYQNYNASTAPSAGVARDALVSPSVSSEIMSDSLSYFPVTMRAIPSCTVKSPADGANNRVYILKATNGNSGVAGFNATQSSVSWRANTPGYGICAWYTADAEL